MGVQGTIDFENAVSEMQGKVSNYMSMTNNLQMMEQTTMGISSGNLQLTQQTRAGNDAGMMGATGGPGNPLKYR